MFHFKQKDWLQFASLLKSGNTMLESLKVMRHETLAIDKCIEEGNKIEDIIVRGQKGKFYEHLSFFLPMTSLPEAIYSAYHMRTFEKDCISNLTKKCSYPIFIFVLSSLSIYMFTNFIIPQLLNGFDMNHNNVLFDVLKLIQLFSFTFLFIAFIFICFCILSTKYHTFHFWCYRYLVHHVFFIKEYISYYLSGYLKELQNHGFSTQDAFQYMDRIQENKFLSYLCKDLRNRLNSGVDMLEAIQSMNVLDQFFQLHYAIGVHNATLSESLTAYIQNTEMKWNRLIARLSISVQIISYSFVGVLMICVYQIMLLPLDMLNQI